MSTPQHTPDCGGEDAPWCSRACEEAADAHRAGVIRGFAAVDTVVFDEAQDILGDTPDTP